MKNDLTCAVVRDLLPSYVEGLTSDETNQAVEAHLAVCPDCARARADMAAPEASDTAEQSREVNYLKTLKRRNGRRVAAAILCTLAVIAAGAALKLFVIGQPASREGMSWTMSCDETAMDLRVYSTWSGVAYCRWEVETTDGVVRLTAKKVLPSFLYRDADHRERIPLDGVREVWVAGQLIWQDGVAIASGVLELYETKTPYVGDAPALDRVANALDIQGKLGPYTNSLHTSSRPYDWTLELANPPAAAGGADLNHRIEVCSIRALALVENLDQVTVTYSDVQGQSYSRTVTEENALELLRSYAEACGLDVEIKDSIKDYAVSPAAFQELCSIYS